MLKEADKNKFKKASDLYLRMNSGIDFNLQIIDQVLTKNVDNTLQDNLFDSEFERELAKKEENLKLERKLEEERLNNLK